MSQIGSRHQAHADCIQARAVKWQRSEIKAELNARREGEGNGDEQKIKGYLDSRKKENRDLNATTKPLDFAPDGQQAVGPDQRAE